MTEQLIPRIQESARITWPLTLTLSTPWMHADLESIFWKFGGDPAICVREEAICAKVYRWRTSIALAHSWNELKTEQIELKYFMLTSLIIEIQTFSIMPKINCVCVCREHCIDLHNNIYIALCFKPT